jgi:O-antigen ligase
MTNSGITSRSATSPVYSSYSVPQADGQNAKPAKIGTTLLAIYIFLLAGRVLDVSPIWWLHIPMILLIVLTVTMISRGKLQYAFDSKITKYFAAFTLWVFVCFPFSYWRAQSKVYLQYQVQSFVIFLIIVQMVRTKQDWQKVVGGFAYATLIASLLAFHFGYTVQGRLALPGGTLGDPNEFALLMVVGLPFWWFKASRAQGFRKVFFLCCTLPIFLAFARAGSRAGLLAMFVLLLISFAFARGVQKIVIVMTAVIAIAASTVLLPGYIQTRFMTFFSAEGNYDAHTEERIDSDIASSEGRKALLKQSIKMTFQHPILGVGPGCFAFVAWDERKSATGQGGESLVSHNTYTQISSETGIPGFILFLSVVFLCVKSVLMNYRRLAPVDMEFAQYARYLFSCMGALAIGIFFLSVGYTHMTATIFAFALSLHKITERVLKEPATSPAAVASGWQQVNVPQWLQSTQSQNRGVAAAASRQPVRSNLRQRYPRLRQHRKIGPETSR